jgi:uncharacterized protein YjbJ (UPF0337 family)
MDRQRTQGNLNSATGAIKEKRGEAAVGDRHVGIEGRADKTDSPRQTKTDPLDAVREVVNNED